jgi:hypothetical protein
VTEAADETRITRQQFLQSRLPLPSNLWNGPGVGHR